MIDLSVIIPVYNVERYLAKCLDSVLADNAFTGQVVCVNDGSTDNSLNILEQYAKNYSNVEIIMQQNAGLSAARNAGIKAAKGEYVCFLDSDDYWEPNVLNGLLEQIERDKLDVLRFKYQNVNEKYEVFNPNKSDPYRNDNHSADVTDGVTFLNTRFGTACYAVMFIVRRELLEGCIFTPGIYFEDTDWTPRMLVKANRVASTDKIVYNYLVREGSITKAVERGKQKKVLDDKMRLIDALQKQASALQKQGKDNAFGILSTDFYGERKSYLAQLRERNIYPLQSTVSKARLINFSPRIAVELLHLKNG